MNLLLLIWMCKYYMKPGHPHSISPSSFFFSLVPSHRTVHFCYHCLHSLFLPTLLSSSKFFPQTVADHVVETSLCTCSLNTCFLFPLSLLIAFFLLLLHFPAISSSLYISTKKGRECNVHSFTKIYVSNDLHYPTPFPLLPSHPLRA